MALTAAVAAAGAAEAAVDICFMGNLGEFGHLNPFYKPLALTSYPSLSSTTLAG